MGLGALAAVGGLAMMVPPTLRSLSYGLNRIDPNLIYAPVEMVELRARGKLNENEYLSLMKALGFADYRASKLWDISENLLGIAELISLYRRGIISQEMLYSDAEKIKWSGFNVTNILKVSEVIPSAQDIIAFAVREVYTPEIAEAFGQYEGGDAVYDMAKDDITAIGMTKENFIKYWAGHWMLPSVGQGFEMVHRGVIPIASTPDKPLSLERLMTALDIMPAWRQPLVDISYSPFTRVDVRRMHKIEVLGDDDLVKAYMDLGYDEDKAGKMAEFTIKYNYEPPEEEQTVKDKEKAKERDLTKTDILYGYENNILDEGLVRGSLSALGYDGNEVEYYISKVNYKREKEETDSYLKYYHDAYIRGIMSHNDLIDKLNALNLSGERSNHLFNMWDLEKMARTTKPTKAELMTFVRKKIITQDTFNSEMLGLGYPERYIEWYRKSM